MTQSSKPLLFAVLNWGLGHASRSIPVIQELLSRNFDVHVASDGISLELLKESLPDLVFHELPSYNIEYGSSGLMANLFLKVPKLIHNVSKEFVVTQKLHEKYNFCGVISDNRPGVRISEVHSVYITHQLQFKAGYLSWILRMGHASFYKSFDEVWIPDRAFPFNLAGELSQTNYKKAKYIGVQTRAKRAKEVKDIHVLCVLSGPEPARTKLEELILSQLKGSQYKVVLVRGVQEGLVEVPDNFKIVNLANIETLNELAARAEVFVARSGYSTLMDLTVWQNKSILVPTPNQPEQEYLAKYISEKGWGLAVDQEELDLITDIPNAVEFAKIEKNPPNWGELLSLFQGK